MKTGKSAFSHLFNVFNEHLGFNKKIRNIKFHWAYLLDLKSFIFNFLGKGQFLPFFGVIVQLRITVNVQSLESKLQVY